MRESNESGPSWTVGKQDAADAAVAAFLGVYQCAMCGRVAVITRAHGLSQPMMPIVCSAPGRDTERALLAKSKYNFSPRAQADSDAGVDFDVEVDG